MKSLYLAASMCASLAWAMPDALAQAYPTRAVTIVIPASPGASTDGIGRQFAKVLEGQFKQPVVVENRAGAGGYVGGSYVARATPDGYTVMYAPDVILYSNLFIKGQRALSEDLLPMASIGTTPYMMFASAKLGVKNLRDFVALVKANPGKFNYGTVGGTTVQLEMASFVRSAGLDMVEIPYPESTSAMRDLAGGSIEFFYSTIGSLKVLIDGGKGFGIAVLGERRSPAVPDVGTAAEQGMNIQYATNVGFFGPLNLPKEVIDRFNRAASDGANSAEGRAILAKFGFDPLSTSPEDMRRVITTNTKRYAEVANQIGLKPQ